MRPLRSVIVRIAAAGRRWFGAQRAGFRVALAVFWKSDVGGDFFSSAILNLKPIFDVI